MTEQIFPTKRRFSVVLDVAAALLSTTFTFAVAVELYKAFAL